MKPEPRDDILLIGVGNTLREDDGVGILLLHRLKKFYSTPLNAIELTEPDISLTRDIAAYPNLLVIDALNESIDDPYALLPLESKAVTSPGGFTSHLFSWGEILYIAGKVFDRVPKAQILGISASHFGVGERISAACEANADKAFKFLIRYCSK